MTRHLIAAGTLILIGSTTPAAGNPPVPYCGADLASMPAARPYVAIRRLDARTERNGKHAWMEVRTTLTPEGGFTYDVLQQGGSDQIRNKALIPVLKREQELIGKGVAVHMPALLAGYDCADPRPTGDGLMSVAIQPREPSRHLVNGLLLVEPGSGAVVRVAGRLSKNPSFWVSDVQMDWEYTRVHNAVVPAAVHARAKVRLIGPSTFDMTYSYESVDGRRVAVTLVAAGGSGRK